MRKVERMTSSMSLRLRKSAPKVERAAWRMGWRWEPWSWKRNQTRAAHTRPGRTSTWAAACQLIR